MTTLPLLLSLLLALAPGAEPPVKGVGQFLGDAAHQGRYGTTGPEVAAGATPKVKWMVTLKGGITSQPLLVNGVLYVATDRGEVHALDAATGKTRWTRKAAEKMIGATPAWADGRILLGGHDRHLRAISADTGEEAWKIKTDERVLAAPAVAGGIVYFASWDGRLRAARVATGEVLWTYVLGEVVVTRGFRGAREVSPVEINAAPAVSGGVVYVALHNELHAVDAATGKRRWVFEGSFGDADAPTVINDGAVYQGTSLGLVVLDAGTGQERWRFPTEKNVMAAAAVRDGVVFVSSWNDRLYALDAATGKQRWAVELEAGQESSPVVVEGRLYMGSSCAVVAVDPATGDRLWTFAPDKGGVRATPVLWDGVYYGATWPGTVFALE